MRKPYKVVIRGYKTNSFKTWDAAWEYAVWAVGRGGEFVDIAEKGCNNPPNPRVEQATVMADGFVLAVVSETNDRLPWIIRMFQAHKDVTYFGEHGTLTECEEAK